MNSHGRPDATQVATRLLILRSVYLAGYCIPPTSVIENLKAAKSKWEYRKIIAEIQRGVDAGWSSIRTRQFRNDVSPDEKTLMDTPVDRVTERQYTDAFWRIESAQALLWCLGMIDRMPHYDTRASDEPLKKPIFQDYAKVIAEARLRPDAEIEAARSDAELWHWRSRTRELIESGTYPPSHPMFKDQPYNTLDGIVRLVAGKLAEEVPPGPTIDEDFPAFGTAYRNLSNDEWCDVRSITIERHLALNWVCGYAPDNRWEKTPTGT